jgi:hypothetical protein
MKLVVVAVPGMGHPSTCVPAAADDTAIEAAGAFDVAPAFVPGEPAGAPDVQAPSATTDANATAAKGAARRAGNARIVMTREE